MTILGRRKSTAPSSSRGEAAKKEKLRKIRDQRRMLLAEPLEPRAMMDGGGFPTLISHPFWNIALPKDVNADGSVTAMDALTVINDLNLRGARSLENSGASAGENGQNPAGFIDVNNDNRVSAMDALQVINQLNSAGEGPPLVRYTIEIVEMGTNDPLTTINKGGFYEMRVLIQDLGILTYMGQTRPEFVTGTTDTALGVFTSYFDMLYNTSATDVQLNESQHIIMTGTPTSGGTFTLSFMDGATLKTTGNIVFQANTSAGRLQTAANIQTALNTTLGPGVVEVVSDSSSQNRWRVRFLNRLSNQDVPEMTAVANASLGAGVAVNISEINDGLVGNTAAYSDALLPRVVTVGGFPINTPLIYNDARGGSRMVAGINDVGALGPLTSPGTDQFEILRVRMNALDAGVVNFNVSIVDVHPDLKTGLYGFANAVSADVIEVIPDTLTITEPLSAGPDSANTTEGSTTPIDIVVTTNDVNNPPTPTTAKTVTAIDLTGTLGTAVILNPTTIRYTPPGGDVSGTDTFKYTVTDANNNIDIGTVTINIAPVNDAPNVNGPVAQTFNEDTSRVFSTGNGNAITIMDVDAASGLLTMTLNVGLNNGTLQLGDVTGLVGLMGNNTHSISTQGTLTELNEALQNLTYTPVGNANTGIPSTPITLAITVDDNGNTGGAAQQGLRNIALNITPVNDAPVVDLTGFTITPAVIEGDPLVLSTANNTRLAVNDIDSGAGPVLVTLTVATGNSISVPAAAGVVIGANNTNVVTLTGAVTAVNAALNGITYTAALGFGGGNETLQIKIEDQGNTGGGNLMDTETVTIIVDPAVRPSARRDQLTVDEDSTAGLANTEDVLANDLVNLLPVGTVARLISFSPTSANGGTITLDDNLTPADDTDDKLIYVPAPDFFGTDSFTYVMNDTSGAGANATGTVDVTVREINDAPNAVDNTLASVAEDAAAFTIPAATLTGNDSAGPLETAQTLTITAVGSPIGGTVTLVAGNPVFTPALNYNGPASFSYTITDNGTTFGAPASLTDTATVSFTITEVNDAPVGVPSPLTLTPIAEDSGNRTIPIADLIASDTPGGDTDEAGQTLTVTNVTSITGGTVAIVGTDVIFTPQANFHGTASFTYTVQDNGTTNGVADPQSTATTVNFTVTPVNDAPVATDDNLQTGEGQQMDFAVLANDSDVDASPTFIAVPGTVSPNTTITIVTGPTNGTATVEGNPGSQVIRYTPNALYNGPDSLTYQINDNDPTAPANQVSNIATLNIDVLPKNDPPVAVSDPNVVTNEDNAVAIDVFANDSDPDTANSLWSFVLVSGPSNGTAVFNTTTRQVDYTPNANYNGPDSFVYRINDNSPIAPINLVSNDATVSINVREVNDVPVANNDPATGAFVAIENRDRTFTAAQLLANDTPGLPANESSQSITLTSVSASSAQGGTVTLVAGVVTYTPALNYTGPDSFTYTITDNGTTAGAADPQTATATVNLNVVSFIPTDIQGYVYVDSNNNGVFDPNERPLGGVDVTLAGTSEITGDITPITMTTNLDGFYLFADVEPGTYTLTETSPFALRDGLETPGLAASLSGTNDQIDLVLPLLGIIGEVSVNNFGEQGVDAAQLTNSAGLVSELLSSSTSTGFVLAATLTGDMFWSWALNGWNGCDGISIDLDADLSAATLTATHNGTNYTTRIFQDPFDLRNANRTNPDTLARLARFRVLGYDASGNHIIRLDGTAVHFYGVGSPLAAAAPASAGEMSAGEYVDGVDAAMAEECWA